jgi:hypothetical protein
MYKQVLYKGIPFADTAFRRISNTSAKRGPSWAPSYFSTSIFTHRTTFLGHEAIYTLAGSSVEAIDDLVAVGLLGLQHHRRELALVD